MSESVGQPSLVSHALLLKHLADSAALSFSHASLASPTAAHRRRSDPSSSCRCANLFSPPCRRRPADHVLQGKHDAHELADRSTVPTLIDESRVRVEPTLDTFPFPHPSLKFNSYARKRGPTIIAKNGVIHLIGEPLLPPFSPLNQIFLAPKYFGLFTNAVQKAEMAGKDDDLMSPQVSGVDALLSGDLSDLDLDLDGLVADLVDEHKEKGHEFTVFLPSNVAFARLPLKVAAFLHSPFPFATKVLKYLLGYHVVPDLVFFTDFVKNGSDAATVAKFLVKEEVDVEVPMSWLMPAPSSEGPHPHPHPPPHAPEHPPYGRANVTHYVLPTLLTEINPNATLKVAVISHRFLGKGPLRCVAHSPSAATGAHRPTLTHPSPRCRRELIIFPSHPPPHHKHGDEKKDRAEGEYRTFGCDHHHEHHDGPPRPHPVKVAYTDLPVRGGAVHVRLTSGFSLNATTTG